MPFPSPGHHVSTATLKPALTNAKAAWAMARATWGFVRQSASKARRTVRGFMAHRIGSMLRQAETPGIDRVKMPLMVVVTSAFSSPSVIQTVSY